MPPRAGSPARSRKSRRVIAQLGGDPQIDPAKHPDVQQAQAALDRARSISRTPRSLRPSDGVVTRVEQLQVGSYVNASTPVFALVATHDMWLEANFKEDQLAHMRVGQEATVQVDSYPGKKFKGKVVSVSPGTGSQFSVLPPENATGNWVKVVQRLPVRVEIEEAGRGLSAACRPERERRGSTRDIDGACSARPNSSMNATSRSCDRESDERRSRHTRPPRREAAASGADHLSRDARVDHAGARQHDRQRRAASHPGLVSSTQDQMAWVLTSYIVAAAIMTPLTRLAGRPLRPPARVPVSRSSASPSRRRCAASRNRCRDRARRSLQGCAARR